MWFELSMLHNNPFQSCLSGCWQWVGLAMTGARKASAPRPSETYGEPPACIVKAAYASDPEKCRHTNLAYVASEQWTGNAATSNRRPTEAAYVLMRFRHVLLARQ